MVDVEDGINGIAPGTLIGFLLDGGTKAAGRPLSYVIELSYTPSMRKLLVFKLSLS